jgi:hypothetical protein
MSFDGLGKGHSSRNNNGEARRNNMTGVFREGHNKRPPRNRGPLVFDEPGSLWRKRKALVAVAGLAIIFAAGWAIKASAHPGTEQHVHILTAPLAGIRNNYWYDYRSDVEEAENELRKDLRRADTAQDRREAWAEYNRELRDARKDYTKEMVEKGYIARPRGEVVVGE